MAWDSTGEIAGFYGDDREEYRFIGPKPNGGMGEKYFTLVTNHKISIVFKAKRLWLLQVLEILKISLIYS